MYRQSFILPGVLLGIGLGGFIDGIIFQQVYQLHSMLSAKLPQDTVVNIKTSMIWDGLFHSLIWLITALGLGTLWSAVKWKEGDWSGIAFWGALLTGWGLFHLLEGFISHYIFQIHHVVERLGLSIYDHLFLLSGVLLIAIGRSLIKIGTEIISRIKCNPAIEDRFESTE